MIPYLFMSATTPLAVKWKLRSVLSLDWWIIKLKAQRPVTENVTTGYFFPPCWPS